MLYIRIIYKQPFYHHPHLPTFRLSTFRTVVRHIPVSLLLPFSFLFLYFFLLLPPFSRLLLFILLSFLLYFPFSSFSFFPSFPLLLLLFLFSPLYSSYHETPYNCHPFRHLKRLVGTTPLFWRVPRTAGVCGTDPTGNNPP